MRSYVQNAPYEQHFGLSRRLVAPGDAGPGPFLGSNRQKLAEQAAVALSPPDSVTVVVGAPGVGKSTLAAAAARIALVEPNLVWLDTSPETPTELIEHLLIESGATDSNVGRIAGSRLWKRTVIEYFENGMPTVVLVENAHLIDSRVLLELNSLTAPDPRGFHGNRLILMGTPGLNSVLERSSLETLRQRIRCRCTVQPMSADDTRSFIEQLVRRAGGEPNEVFGPGSLSMLHSYSGGIPRVSQTLCESALSVAATRNVSFVSARIVHDVAATMIGMQRLDNENDTVENNLRRALFAGITASELKRQHSGGPNAFDSTIDPVPTLTDVVAVESVDEMLIADSGDIDELLFAGTGDIDELLFGDQDADPDDPPPDSPPSPDEPGQSDHGRASESSARTSPPSRHSYRVQTAFADHATGKPADDDGLPFVEEQNSQTSRNDSRADTAAPEQNAQHRPRTAAGNLIYDEDAYEREIEAALKANGE